jgi:hypothetical protein
LQFLIALHFCCFWYVPEFDRPEPNLIDQNQIVNLVEEAHHQREEFFAKVLYAKKLVCCKFYKMFNLIAISLSLGKRES